MRRPLTRYITRDSKKAKTFDSFFLFEYCIKIDKFQILVMILPSYITVKNDL